MRKIFSIISGFVILTVINCSNTYAVEMNLNDFNYNNLQKYNKIDKNGAIYRNQNGTIVYPTYDGQKCYDLKYMIENKTKKTKYGNCTINNPNVNKFNLVVANFNGDQFNETTYTLTRTNGMPDYNGKENWNKPKSFLKIDVAGNTNLIIPYGTTLNCKDIMLIFCEKHYSLLVLGNLTNRSQTYMSVEYNDSSFLYFNPNDHEDNTIIIGPKSNYTYENTNMYSPIHMEWTNNINFVLYPGCKLQTKKINDTFGTNKYIIDQYEGNLYLNRYIQPGITWMLEGIISKNSHIIFPKNLEDSNNRNTFIREIYTLESAGKDKPKNNYIKTPYFPTLYWEGTHHEFNKNLGNNTTYCFEDPELPLDFIPYKNDQNKKILSIKDNTISKCDVLFWNQCSPNNIKYGLLRYNINNYYMDKYINVDTLESLFYNGKTYKVNGLLQHMPDIIYPGLIGKSNISIMKNIKSILLLGNNSEYSGIMTIPSTVTDIYLKQKSMIEKIRYNNKIYVINTIDKIIPRVSFHYIDVIKPSINIFSKIAYNYYDIETYKNNSIRKYRNPLRKTKSTQSLVSRCSKLSHNNILESNKNNYLKIY